MYWHPKCLGVDIFKHSKSQHVWFCLHCKPFIFLSMDSARVHLLSLHTCPLPQLYACYENPCLLCCGCVWRGTGKHLDSGGQEQFLYLANASPDWQERLEIAALTSQEHSQRRESAGRRAAFGLSGGCEEHGVSNKHRPGSAGRSK